ncbi:cytochrome c oxidase subunit 3 [Planctomycetes bacterium TBK1r]|uniref:Cytochrome c oxidase subunit 3 n=1 Tax=Stieleria magnilauensis TaxID=2527963 RepID=A0ABX5XV14_9BACT|nr:Cytochrome c oxidase subunit 3 [Planctomycetes bacterium TBK1r]
MSSGATGVAEVAKTLDGIDCRNETGWTAAKVGMAAFLFSEAVFFTTLLIGYITFLGAEMSGPTPGQSLNLEIAIINSVFLIPSSFTMMLAVRAFGRGKLGGFTFWMFATIALGIGFLGGTAYEWRELIWVDGLTISRNVFGTTYFTLIGFHATHVTVGMLLMAMLVWRARRGQMSAKSEAPELLSWYWHLVDTVWLAIVLVVYVLGH